MLAVDPRLKRVWAHPVTGELRIWRRRWIRRRVRYMRGSRGFLSVNDGVAVMDQLSRAMRVRNAQRMEWIGAAATVRVGHELEALHACVGKFATDRERAIAARRARLGRPLAGTGTMPADAETGRLGAARAEYERRRAASPRDEAASRPEPACAV